jgi:Ni/Co efflux regulator RcnB
MRRTLLALSAAAVALTGATAAQAQSFAGVPGFIRIDDDDWYDDWDDRRDAYREYRKDQRKAERDLRKAERKLERAERKYERAQRRAWARGQYLPASYRSTRYVVRDYRVYHLPPPPPGYAYYRSDDDILLTAVASGLITRVLADVLR